MYLQAHPYRRRRVCVNKFLNKTCKFKCIYLDQPKATKFNARTIYQKRFIFFPYFPLAFLCPLHLYFFGTRRRRRRFSGSSDLWVAGRVLIRLRLHKDIALLTTAKKPVDLNKYFDFWQMPFCAKQCAKQWARTGTRTTIGVWPRPAINIKTPKGGLAKLCKPKIDTISGAICTNVRNAKCGKQEGQTQSNLCHILFGKTMFLGGNWG